MLKQYVAKIQQKFGLEKTQWLKFALMVAGGVLLISLVMVLGKSHKDSPHLYQAKKIDFSGVVDKQFSKDDAESAMTEQQLELDSLKKEIKSLTEGVKSLKQQNEEQKQAFSEELVKAMSAVQAQVETNAAQNAVKLAQNQVGQPGDAPVSEDYYLKKPKNIHSVSYENTSYRPRRFSKTPQSYVPSGTFAKAVILGGADADASVDGQQKNNSVMLFKILDRGVLPNGKRSYLQGCFVTGSTYGDISSERAYVKLDKISCAQEGRPIVDKAVSGWAFFGGKVGIKGIPLMRDSKIVAWAGVSGALSGVAQAAQYAQSVQNFGAYGGATSVVPSGSIGPFAAYGGASKAAQQLSEYYIKRAEQYHPVIQVGAGNVVNIVFKDGFYFDDEDERQEGYSNKANASSLASQNGDPIIPEDVLSQIDRSQTAMNSGVRR